MSVTMASSIINLYYSSFPKNITLFCCESIHFHFIQVQINTRSLLHSLLYFHFSIMAFTYLFPIGSCYNFFVFQRHENHAKFVLRGVAKFVGLNNPILVSTK
ncbi:hypothetical protein L6452_23069 [Arctium lappa]|uniref:Uncharacterized protein n=1 Tax=Arctium lappa TaxID=4217 RepID=A0ACB9B0T0_ARCLA|nr:hypothetical protein L6452_23069 [Arctium lappa]